MGVAITVMSGLQRTSDLQAVNALPGGVLGRAGPARLLVKLNLKERRRHRQGAGFLDQVRDFLVAGI